VSRYKVVALPGDGIGPEVIGAARRLLDEIATRFGAEFEIEELPVGGVSIDEHGVPLLPEVLDRCRGADAVLLGAVGGPKWDSTDPEAPRPEQGLLGLRKGPRAVRQPAAGAREPGARRREPAAAGARRASRFADRP
jgi:3-isopropylmalate dehydrogenase